MDLLSKAQSDPYLIKCCYVTNNNFAYQYDTESNYKENIKIYNFVPTYDKWCLFCGNKNSRYKCSKCKSVYFCSKLCQRLAWKIHKTHCGRDLFTLCISCGLDKILLKCPDCSVKFCSDKCKDKLISVHKDFDCKYFTKNFKS